MPADDQGPETASPIDLQLDRPHSARMYDYYLGGKDNYEVDRQAAVKVAEILPFIEFTARANRAFMHRATRFLAQQGVRQFLDIGTGIPTEPNLHQVAQAVSPQARVVYVDNDPLVLAHARALLVSSPEGRTAYVSSDVTEPQAILDSPQVQETIDLSRPVALSMYALLHFVPDGRDPDGILRILLDALVPGSYLVLSHATLDDHEHLAGPGEETYRSSGIDLQLRSRDEFARFFDGLALVEPGVVLAHRWRPIDGPPPESIDHKVPVYVGMART